MYIKGIIKDPKNFRMIHNLYILATPDSPNSFKFKDILIDLSCFVRNIFLGAQI